MSKIITLEIPETEARSLEAALDQALIALRQLDADTNNGREERIALLRAETHVLMDQIRAMLHVEEAV